MLIDYPQTIDDVYKILEDYNPTKKKKVLIVSNYMTVDTESNNLKAIVTYIIFKRKKTQYSTCFYIIILFPNS